MVSTDLYTVNTFLVTMERKGNSDITGTRGVSDRIAHNLAGHLPASFFSCFVCVPVDFLGVSRQTFLCVIEKVSYR